MFFIDVPATLHAHGGPRAGTRDVLQGKFGALLIVWNLNLVLFLPHRTQFEVKIKGLTLRSCQWR